MEDHDHLSRYEYHRRVGLVLAESDAAHPWGCVAVFYAAFHSARWALRRDPRFDDVAALKKINPHLMPGDRHTAKHKARRSTDPKQPPDFGVNDLVLLMYPSASNAYEKLHQASIEVRYNRGAPAALPTAQRLSQLLDSVHTVFGSAVVMGPPKP